MSGVRPGGVAFLLERETDGATLQVIVGPKGSEALLETSAGAVHYRKFSGLGEAEAAETARLFGDLLERGAVPLPLLFPHLAMGHEAGDEDRRRFAALIGSHLLAPSKGDACGAERPGHPAGERPEVYFDPPGIAELLAPEVTVGGAPVAGHVFRAVYRTSTGRRQALDFSSYALEFVSAATGAAVQLRLSAEENDEGFGRAGELLTIGVLGPAGTGLEELPADVASLASWILALLRLKVGKGTTVFIPGRTEELRSIDYPSGWTTRPAPAASLSGRPPDSTAELQRPPALNLALDAECAQECVFCSVKSYVHPEDGGEAELDGLLMQLRRARASGIDEVRLNGIDPLAFSRVLDVVGAVRAEGFPRLTVFSPCRRFADDGFRREFLRRAPPHVEISVPLYGSTAAVHDAVVGMPGAHADVARAVDGLLETLPAARVHLTTVVVRQNLHELGALARFARERRMAHHVKMPYPMRQTARDPYADSVVRESTVVDAFLDQITTWGDRAWALGILGSFGHPCLRFRAEQRSGLPLFAVNATAQRQLLPGTEYRKTEAFVHESGGAASGDEAFVVSTVRCPHEARCALAPVCPGEHYAVYEKLFGLSEFEPVLPIELYRAVPLSRWRGPVAGQLRRALQETGARISGFLRGRATLS